MWSPMLNVPGSTYTFWDFMKILPGLEKRFETLLASRLKTRYHF